MCRFIMIDDSGVIECEFKYDADEAKRLAKRDIRIMGYGDDMLTTEDTDVLRLASLTGALIISKDNLDIDKEALDEAYGAFKLLSKKAFYDNIDCITSTKKKNGGLVIDWRGESNGDFEGAHLADAKAYKKRFPWNTSKVIKIAC